MIEVDSADESFGFLADERRPELVFPQLNFDNAVKTLRESRLTRRPRPSAVRPFIGHACTTSPREIGQVASSTPSATGMRTGFLSLRHVTFRQS